MFLVVKKWNIIFIALICIFSVLTICTLCNRGEVVSVSSVPGFGKVIIVDAGHGEPDGGAVGYSGTLEEALNLSIAQKLQSFLETGGSEVIITRSDENGLFEVVGGSIRQKKRNDLKSREKIMNNSDADLFISIHMNKFTDSKYSGPQVFYTKNDDNSKRFAEIVQKSLIENLAPNEKREIKQAGSEIYLLSKAKIPAVLVECGFLSNPDEERKLNNEEYQKSVAWSIYNAVVNYFSE